jgi:Uma2 family endonuclease
MQAVPLFEPRGHDSDHIVLINATWSDYQRFLELRGDRSSPRLAYLNGTVELMSPSQEHESIKSIIGRLIEVWCLHFNIEFQTFGSWTLENEETARGVEPDECYVFSAQQKPARPDLVIEVIWTSGGLDKREIYRALEVPEIWFWKRGKITAYVLRGDTYVEQTESERVPGIDLEALASFIDRPTTSQSIREYRNSLATG